WIGAGGWAAVRVGARVGLAGFRTEDWAGAWTGDGAAIRFKVSASWAAAGAVGVASVAVSGFALSAPACKTRDRVTIANCDDGRAPGNCLRGWYTAMPSADR